MYTLCNSNQRGGAYQRANISAWVHETKLLQHLSLKQWVGLSSKCMIFNKSWGGVRDLKVTDSFKGHFIPCITVMWAKWFSFHPQLYHHHHHSQKMYFQGRALNYFFRPDLSSPFICEAFDSLRRDWIEGQWNGRGKSPHIQSSDGQGRLHPQRHLPATSFWQAGSKLQFISAHARNRRRVSEERENFLSSGLKDLFHIQLLMVGKSRTRAIRWKPSPVPAGGSKVLFQAKVGAV